MKRGIHLKKTKSHILTKDGSGVIYNLVQVVKKKKPVSGNRSPKKVEGVS